MNIKIVLRALGLILLSESAFMVPSLGLALVNQGSDLIAFAISIVVTALIGILFARQRPDTKRVGTKEGFIVATLGWLLLAIFGSLPFILSGVTPHPVDAFFETMSGFTTTGATIIPDVESVPMGILFWRSLTHWLGGMGIIVLTLALIPSLDIAGFQMFKAEVPGPTKSKVLPRVAKTSRELYKVYLGITVILLVLLKLAGLSWFDSFIHTFGTVGTGGFSNKNSSVGFYNDPTVELIIIIFMVLCGINFSLYFDVLRKKPSSLLRDNETRAYLGIILVTTLLITFNLINLAGYQATEALRHGLFQVASIITTTGYASIDFDQWPNFSRYLLLLLMFVGACAGSTGGGVKVIRYVIMFKAAKNQIFKLIHPQAVVPLRLGQRVIHQDVVQTIHNFFIVYLAIFATVTGLLIYWGIDFISAASAVVSCLSNVGPGLALVGPATTYAPLPVAAKAVLSLCMLVGRLEIYTVLVALNARSWK